MTVGGQRNKAMANEIVAADKAWLKSRLDARSSVVLRVVEDVFGCIWNCRAEVVFSGVFTYRNRHGIRTMLSPLLLSFDEEIGIRLELNLFVGEQFQAVHSLRECV